MITVPFATDHSNDPWLLHVVGLEPVMAYGHSWRRPFNGLIIVRTVAASPHAIDAFLTRMERGRQRAGFDVYRHGFNWGLFEGYLNSYDQQVGTHGLWSLHRVTFTGTYELTREALGDAVDPTLPELDLFGRPDRRINPGLVLS